MGYRPNINREAQRMQEHGDRNAVAGDYGTNNAEFDAMVEKELKAYRPKETDFVGVYPQSEVDRDLAEIQAIKNSEDYDPEREFSSTLAENVIAWGIHKRGWLGPYAKVTVASEYDDIKRGTDLSVYIEDQDAKEDEPEYFNIAIDVTATRSANRLRAKLKSSIQRLDYGDESVGNPGGQLTRTKYLATALDEKKKPIEADSPSCNYYIMPLSRRTAELLSSYFVLDPECKAEPSLLETAASIQVNEVLIKQAALEIIHVLDKYCGDGGHRLESYRRLPDINKSDLRKMFFWVEEHFDEIERHLKETWSKVDKYGRKTVVSNSVMFESILKNLKLIRSLSPLLDELRKKEGVIQFLQDDSHDFGAEYILGLTRNDIIGIDLDLHHQSMSWTA